MKLVTFSAADSKHRSGAWIDNEQAIVDLTTPDCPDALAVIAAGVHTVDKQSSGSRYKFGEVRLHAPLANPPRIFAIGLNYRAHAIETGLELPKFPVVFIKLSTAIIGPGENIVLPKNSTQPDYEAEMAFVIGKGGYRIPAAEWREHVYGYTIVNDISARDIQMSTSQWSLSKCFPTFCPLGPAIVTADEVPDPHALGIQLHLNGERMQSSNTHDMLFKIPELIEYISSITPLLPGDIVSTGTPPGVGFGRTPPRWLRAGDSVTVTIEKLGSLTNPIVAEGIN